MGAHQIGLAVAIDVRWNNVFGIAVARASARRCDWPVCKGKPTACRDFDLNPAGCHAIVAILGEVGPAVAVEVAGDPLVAVLPSRLPVRPPRLREAGPGRQMNVSSKIAEA